MRVDHLLFEEFQVMTDFKQEYALSPLLFDIVLEKVVRSVQRDDCDVDISKKRLAF
jgi:hypothetical protein